MFLSTMKAVFHGASTVSNLPLSSSSKKNLELSKEGCRIVGLITVFFFFFAAVFGAYTMALLGRLISLFTHE